MTDTILREQIEYYRARASEYDEWFLRVGRYDHGETLNQQWFDEVELFMKRLWSLESVEHILELACGTGIWTKELVKLGKHVTALDSSPEMLAINQQKVNHQAVTYHQADIFAWKPTQTYDMVFFSFWLSHVPPERVLPFLQMETPYAGDLHADVYVFQRKGERANIKTLFKSSEIRFGEHAYLHFGCDCFRV